MARRRSRLDAGNEHRHRRHRSRFAGEHRRRRLDASEHRRASRSRFILLMGVENVESRPKNTQGIYEKQLKNTDIK